ncbi:MAG: hypothetical protein ACD_7C00020G0019 [uncultured bacterium]|nr:MAG: hypothetical protein ACD_7C00020G0019 [uncultured bacterium]HBR79844.1 hypothetical protein [Candidatus Moranbacteria bacterium]
MLSTPKTIKIFLAEGNPMGMKTIEISNWSGKAVSVPRNKLREFFSREEFFSPAVYFLLSLEPEESGLHRVYIGKANNLKERLTDHDYKKDFWQIVIAFFGGNIEYLENKCLEMAVKEKRCVLENKNNAKPRKLNEAEEAEANEYLSNLSILMSALGYPILSPILNGEKVNEKNEPSGDILFCKGAGVYAKGRQVDGGFEVLQGSTASISEPTLASSKKMKNFLIEEKIIELDSVNKNSYVFIRDYIFNSPSSASNIILSYANTGRDKWKDENGKSLAELEKGE